MAEYYVDIIQYDTDEVVETLGPYASERQADRADSGVNINLDHERFYTQIRKEGDRDQS